MQVDLDNTPAINVRGLTREYQMGDERIHALRGVDLTIPAGQFVAIVGVSGSGKSTLLHLLGGLDSPTAGTIRIAGDDITMMSEKERTMYRRTSVGVVFQSFFLVPNLTALQNVSLSLTLRGTYGSQREKLTSEALARVNMGHRAQHRPHQLSGGEQQRVSIARAIVHRPRLLLADEPTGNLDQATAHRLMELLVGIRTELATTIVMVTHDEKLATSYCDQSIRMHDGRFVDNRDFDRSSPT